MNELQVRAIENGETVKDTVLCPAKINLFLEVTSRREDGYHEIDSIMQKVALCDRLDMTFQKGEGIVITSNDRTLPTGEKNLVYRAIVGYFEKAGLSFHTEVYLFKRIPVSAGLAGGSTDAAGALKILQRRFHALSQKDMAALALSLGADVPFCLFRSQAVCKGLGEKLSACRGLPDCFVVIAKHRRESVSTKEAYKTLDETPFVPNSSDAMTTALEKGELEGVIATCFNRFEAFVLPHKPIAGKIKEAMLKAGAAHAMMSGSGPSVFGIFKTREEAVAAKEAIRELGVFAYITHPWR